MNNYRIQIVSMPNRIKGLTSYDTCDDFYTILINANLNCTQQKDALYHELKHINNDDFRGGFVSTIEHKLHSDK